MSCSLRQIELGLGPVVAGGVYVWQQGRELLVQQWLVQALVIDNLSVLCRVSLWGLVILGGLGFGLIHIEYPWLVVATGLLGGVYVVLFLWWRNLWPLAVVHGWLGSLFYPWVLGRNPITERAWLERGLRPRSPRRFAPRPAKPIEDLIGLL